MTAGSLTLIEGETGSGKTEAALWHALRYYQAGLVDGAYFALPTRTSGVMIHARVARAVKAAFGEMAPPVVLAVPGYVRVDDQDARILDRFTVRWDDDLDGSLLLRGWAAENAKRYLASPFAVGTIDQALMAVLRAKHGHMRAAALARSMLIIDEVHASDTYMTRLGTELVRRHVAGGGHVLLMSATLGAEAAGQYFGMPCLPLAEATALPYPLVRQSNALGRAPEMHPMPRHAAAEEDGRNKDVAMEAHPITSSPGDIARLAAGFARDGARVLVIRNTVGGCIAVRHALARILPPEMQFRCRGVAAPHHGRFAAEDRRLLDVAVEAEFGRQRPHGGLILVATQTVEQSLDIDADILLTDLCPMDVILQRIGRLHRHDRPHRPSSFCSPRCLVLTPTDDLLALTKRAAHGLGRNRAYEDIRVTELTLRAIAEHPTFSIPAMNRQLVEQAVHPEAKVALHAEDAGWAEHGRMISGEALGKRTNAASALLPLSSPFGSAAQYADWDSESRVSTRLGASAVSALFPGNARPRSPFDPAIRLPLIAIPHWMAPRAVGASEVAQSLPTLLSEDADGFTFGLGGEVYAYGADGLQKI